MNIYNKRLLGIDFLRFICVSLIFGSHFINFEEINNLHLLNLVHNLKYATELFFVISAFIIAKISFEAKYSKLIFILKRFYKFFFIGYVIIFFINPNFFLSNIADCFNSNNFLNIPWFLSLDNKQLCLRGYATGVSWTVIVEVYFYILFSIFYFNEFKSGNFVNIFDNKLKSFIILSIFVLCILRPLLDLIYYKFGSFVYENRNNIPFSHFDSFFYGIIFFIFSNKISTFKYLNLILFTNIFIILFIFLVFGDTFASRPLASFLGLNLLIYFFYNQSKFNTVLNLISLLGKASFVFYIIHMDLFDKLSDLLGDYNSIYIIYSCIWLISLMLYMFVEVPLTRLGNFFLKHG
jgi:peptidoglycan/LPS O-acetylase OafA/YrhL